MHWWNIRWQASLGVMQTVSRGCLAFIFLRLVCHVTEAKTDLRSNHWCFSFMKNVNKLQLKGVLQNDFIALNFSDGNIIVKLQRQLSLAHRCGFWVVCGKSPPNWGCLTHIYGYQWVWKGFLNLHEESTNCENSKPCCLLTLFWTVFLNALWTTFHLILWHR